jgi:PAP2 superfamily protein
MPRTKIVAVVVCLLAASAAPAHAHSNAAPVVVAWNAKANEVAAAAGSPLAFKEPRALAMVHLAQLDALSDRRADPAAAAAQAGHDVLLAEYVAQQPEIDALLELQLAAVRPGRAKAAGIAAGRRAAAAIVAARRGDGYDFEGTYTFRDGPGEYRTTPPFGGFVLQPGFGRARPFVLRSPQALRPGPPPSLHSREYASALREVARDGRVDSVTRSADETGYAVWWMEFAEHSVNRLARRLVTESRLRARHAARLFADLNVGLFDGYVAVWDAKFAYNHWRPYTAIREAGLDPAWEPLRTTPPFPDYPSAHAAACASSFATLARAFGDRTRFTMETATAPPGMPTRTFRSFSAAAEECADSRVKLGFHFRYATEAGARLGRRVAERVARED